MASPEMCLLQACHTWCPYSVDDETGTKLIVGAPSAIRKRGKECTQGGTNPGTGVVAAGVPLLSKDVIDD